MTAPEHGRGQAADKSGQHRVSPAATPSAEPGSRERLAAPTAATTTCARCGCAPKAHHKLHCEGRDGNCACYGGWLDPGSPLSELDRVGQQENAEYDAGTSPKPCACINWAWPDMRVALEQNLKHHPKCDGTNNRPFGHLYSTTAVQLAAAEQCVLALTEALTGERYDSIGDYDAVRDYLLDAIAQRIGGTR